MNVFIRGVTGKNITIENVLPSDTVHCLKEKLENKEGIPSIDQQLTLDGKLLSCDTFSLSHYNIQHESTLNLSLSLHGGWQVYLKYMKCRPITIDVDEKSTVLSLKQQIFDKEGLAVEDIMLIYAGKLLEDDRTMQSYNIQKESTLSMVLKPRK